MNIEKSFLDSIKRFFQRNSHPIKEAKYLLESIIELSEKNEQTFSSFIETFKNSYQHASDIIAKSTNEKYSTHLTESLIQNFFKEYYRKNHHKLVEIGLKFWEINYIYENDINQKQVIDSITKGDIRQVAFLGKKRIKELVETNQRTDCKLDQIDDYVFDAISDIINNKHSFQYLNTIPKEFHQSIINRYHQNLMFIGDKLYTKSTFKIEETIGKFISERLGNCYKIPFTNSSLDEVQNLAVGMALSNNISIIGGGPGTGKTTIIRHIYDEISSRNQVVVILSFTGKAVLRIKEVTGIEDCFTIHRFMSLYKVSSSQIDHLRDFDYLVIDESSMVASNLFYKFISCFSHDYRVVFIGDPNQIEPIQYGKFFHQMIFDERISKTILERVYRNRGVIQTNAVKFLCGDFESLESNTNFMIVNQYSFIEKIIQGFKLKNINLNDFKILCYLNESCDKINQIVRKIYFQTNDTTTFVNGDVLMMQKNNYDISVMNGEEGIVTSINPLIIRFHNEEFEFKRKKGGENPEYLKYSYSITIHKAQGSQFKYVIYYCDSRMIDKQLSYTAMTRPTDKLIVVDPFGYFRESCFREMNEQRCSICEFIE